MKIQVWHAPFLAALSQGAGAANLGIPEAVAFFLIPPIVTRYDMESAVSYLRIATSSLTTDPRRTRDPFIPKTGTQPAISSA